MTDRKDIMLNAAGNDLLIENGDFVVEPSDNQHVYLILRLNRSNIKQFPLIGVGEERFLNGNIDGSLRREIQLQLESDGYKPKRLVVTPDNIDVVI